MEIEETIAAWIPSKNGLRRRPAAVLEPRDSDRVDATGRPRPAASPGRGVSELAAPLDGPRPQGPGPHHTLAPEPNRCGAAPDTSPRGPDRPDRRFHGAQDSGLRRMERAQAEGIEETPEWRKLPIGVDAAGFIVAAELTASRGHDACTLPDLLDQIEVPIRRFTAHEAYEHRSIYARGGAAGSEDVVIVIPSSSLYGGGAAQGCATRSCSSEDSRGRATRMAEASRASPTSCGSTSFIAGTDSSFRHPAESVLKAETPAVGQRCALRGIQAPTRAGRDGKRLNSTVYCYTFLRATLYTEAGR